MENTKAIDTHGNPLKLYHGTENVFSKFSDHHSTKYGLFGPGHYFTESPEVASRFAKVNRHSVNEPTPNVHVVYLNIQNLLDLENDDIALKMGAMQLVDKDGIDAYSFYKNERESSGKKLHTTKNQQYYRAIEGFFIRQSSQNVEGISTAHSKIQAPLYEEIGQSRMMDYLSHLGYDGIRDGTTWVCFRDEQIHSALQTQVKHKNIEPKRNHALDALYGRKAS